MKFHDTPLADAKLIELEKRGDERGFFARAFCKKEFAEAGLPTEFVQVNNSDSAEAGTLRGMHYQLGEDAETKLVRCIKGSLWDCIIDLRPDSPTFKKWYGVKLSADNRRMLAVPRGFAHGFITLEPGTEAFYFVDNYYAPDAERGIRHDDPEFGIQWPREPAVQSDKDKSWRDFDPSWHLGAK